MRVLDAHHHFWSLTEVRHGWVAERGVQRFFGDPTPIQNDYLPEHLVREANGVVDLVGSVHVQVGVAEGAEVEETAWLARLAERTGLPSAAVAFADLTRPDLDAVLDRHCAHGVVRGIRHIVGRRADEDAARGTDARLRDPDFKRGLSRLAERGLSFDLQARFDQLDACARLLEETPALDVALCHLGSPWDRSEAGRAVWLSGVKRLAANPRIRIKLSGFGMIFGPWRADDVWPYVADALEAFGAHRAMFGSNHPVDTLRQPAASTWAEAMRLSTRLSEDEKRAVFENTAREFYRLG
jgi:predicted TIM-barrel fold metal-dependent hydrolase